MGIIDSAVFDVDAVGLTQVVNNLNHGIDVGGNEINPPTGLLIGVGANPCAVEPERELNHYLNKINAGAEYAITNPSSTPKPFIAFSILQKKKGPLFLSLPAFGL